MSHDEFTRLFNYMRAGFADMHKEFARIYNKIDQIYGIIDNHEKHLEISEQERLASNAQLDRHETRITHVENNIRATNGTSR